jgi:hypothetical protein
MRWLVLLTLAGCHLAETIDPPTCPPKSHLQGGQCVADPVEGPLVSIAACVLTPDPITVAINGEFRFQNDDDVDRMITGDDGTVWGTVKAKQPSTILAITKAGSWRYHLSGCPNAGTVIVE